ncbi:hypothetical protein AWC38_SpisGene8733 [Stylophora pistillata]|uniref:Uncharacterized protein n=1 Tax=Stylophora pistillata TaxID=50429 RepID=A0A2B4SC23_STYPI|nr:hypothetical protein AWC38_SpisGene8733 [Stylophora pistillata]
MVVPVSRGIWKTHTYLGEFCEFYELLDAQSTALATNSFQGLLKGYRRVLMVLEVSRMSVKVERDRLSCVSVIKMQAQLVQVVSSISIGCTTGVFVKFCNANLFIIKLIWVNLSHCPASGDDIFLQG